MVVHEEKLQSQQQLLNSKAFRYLLWLEIVLCFVERVFVIFLHNNSFRLIDV